MSRILRRPMFRGGRVDSRGTGIQSGLADGGRVGYQPGGSVSGLDFLKKVKEILEFGGKFPTKVSMGDNYHMMRDVTEKFNG